jgi:serine/threonine protein kinase
MATVYLAWDESLRIERAVKLLSAATSANPEARARVENEARAMASLKHPNVVAIHDIREDEGRIFIVMELVPGGTLWEWVRAHGPLPPRLAVEVMLPVLDAVRAAHAVGMVHRDLKPQNILLDLCGVPRVGDFGIARLPELQEGMSLTRTGSTLGTWSYMAPEQRRDPRTAGPACDVYSLGATLFSLLCGRQPFDLFAAGEDADLLAGIRPDLAQVIRRATRFRVEDRFASIDDLAAALAEILPELPPIPEGTPPLGVRPEPIPGGDLPTAEAPLGEPSLITHVDSAGPAAGILYRRRHLLAALEEEPPTPPRVGIGVWATAAPALMALLAGAVVLALGPRVHGPWDRAILALLGHASVEARGDALSVSLQGSDGAEHEPGTLPPGSYRVMATFEDGAAPVLAGDLDLQAGQVADLLCDAHTQRCVLVAAGEEGP